MEVKLNDHNTNAILDKHFTPAEISNGIKLLKMNKAVGLDAISNEMIKCASGTLNSHLCKLFNLVIDSECYPTAWSKGYIIPLYKKGSNSDPSNYRGISICNCTGKLFALLLNNRLQEFLAKNNIISKFQNGFQKNRRTSDHIFVLKCLIEEAKSKKRPIYGCFVDLKKAFDSVWIQGLLYKMSHKYNVSSKLIRIFKSMYGDLKARVYSNGILGPLFKITIGTRQGCNLSPTLFNLFINDIPLILSKAKCDPVTLNSIEINALMYADDMLLLSKSTSGLNRSLKILEVYCRKWQLQVNTDKTKVMIFNKLKISNMTFKLNGSNLEIVSSYNYLGIKISKSGSFVPAIKELSEKAHRAFMALTNSFTNTSVNPRLFMKLFDSLVKPISTYGSEVWGAFGLKNSKLQNIPQYLYQRNCTPYEMLHIKACKRSLHISRKASNFGALSELGRLPIMYNILSAICKYRIHLNGFDKNELVYHALKSQENLKYNSNKSYTYTDFTDKLMEDINLPISQQIHNGKQLGNTSRLISNACKIGYSQIFHKTLSDIKSNPESKLSIYGKLKTNMQYEPYLNTNMASIITRFRLSDHYLPIERGRYVRPKIPRHMRVCTVCDSGVGNESHVLFECQHIDLKGIRDNFFDKIIKIIPQIVYFSDYDKLLYLLNATDKTTNVLLAQWLSKINVIFKDKKI